MRRWGAGCRREVEAAAEARCPLLRQRNTQCLLAARLFTNSGEERNGLEVNGRSGIQQSQGTRNYRKGKERRGSVYMYASCLALPRGEYAEGRERVSTYPRTVVVADSVCCRCCQNGADAVNSALLVLSLQLQDWVNMGAGGPAKM